ncbi:MAG: FAD-dependent oxidoreductase, partial [Zoogloea sp.]|nr:FAD-dependent oxidoreductase [Zoogloea sp.]
EHDGDRTIAIEPRFLDSDGRLTGFALLGDATARKQALAKEVPAVLA